MKSWETKRIVMQSHAHSLVSGIIWERSSNFRLLGLEKDAAVCKHGVCKGSLHRFASMVELHIDASNCYVEASLCTGVNESMNEHPYSFHDNTRRMWPWQCNVHKTTKCAYAVGGTNSYFKLSTMQAQNDRMHIVKTHHPHTAHGARTILFLFFANCTSHHS